MSTPTWLLVGLGNPGPTYANTRHNVGFFVIDEIARRGRVSLSGGQAGLKGNLHAEVGATTFSSAGWSVPASDAVRVVLAKPRTFMNESGKAVRALCDYYKVAPEHVVVIHDELDLEFGSLRLKLGGGDNGHNGLKSIRAHLGTGDVFRVRYGIGRPPGRQSAADYVLAPIAGALKEDFGVETARSADAIATLLSLGLERAQNQFNS